ncbi:MAG: hypothetical protein HAW59_06055 [Betaproteobacteria bacterium]|nr:hypothetical protein [Betaproteobacteria bacterium]
MPKNKTQKQNAEKNTAKIKRKKQNAENKTVCPKQKLTGGRFLTALQHCKKCKQNTTVFLETQALKSKRFARIIFG